MRYATVDAVNALQAWYHQDLGLYHWDDPGLPSAITKVGNGPDQILERYQDTERWWNTANATGTLVDYIAVSGDRSFLPTIVNTFAVAQGTFSIDPDTVENDAKNGAIAAAIATITSGIASAGGVVNPVISVVTTAVGALLGGIFGGGHAAVTTFTHFANFINPLPTGFLDDEGWWAETWIKAYDLTRDERYLDMAKTIFADMTTGWDTDYKGGGIWWERNHEDPKGHAPYKNTIPNALFFALAARLYIRTGDASYATWAQQEWDWYLGTGLVTRELTGLGLAVDSFVDQTIWTYNQGVLVGALCDWYAVTGDATYLTYAKSIATAAIQHFGYGDGKRSGAGAGIVIEDCDPGYTPDSETFKGPFMRNLGKLAAMTGDGPTTGFVEINAAAVLACANPSSQIGAQWQVPYDAAAPPATDFCRQTAGIDALNAGNRVTTPVSVKAQLAPLAGAGPIHVRAFFAPPAGTSRGTLKARSLRACVVAATM